MWLFCFLVNCTRMCLAQIHYHTKEESKEKIFYVEMSGAAAAASTTTFAAWC